MKSFHSLLIQAAHDEGFPLAGALDLDLAPMGPHVEKYDEWLKAGYAGAMEYLKRGRDRRADPKLVFPAAKSILCVAIPYLRQPAGAQSPAVGPRYARYLQSSDYHTTMAKRLERVMQMVAQECTINDLPVPGWKVCVDTSAVLERSWAALAGLGWIGKNTLLIHPKLGSYLFLGEVLIDQKTNQGPKPLPDYCGNCTRCLSACPTEAFPVAHTLDSNRCISYLTLEKRGALEVSTKVQEKMSTWVAGCDICQEVCPFNFKPSRTELPVNVQGATELKTWESLLAESEDQYRRRVSDSSLSRVKPAQFRRNLAVGLANAIQTDFDQAAREKFKELIEARAMIETDEIARQEWEKCLALITSPLAQTEVHRVRLEPDSKTESEE